MILVRIGRCLKALFLAALLSTQIMDHPFAAELGKGTYLLGGKGPQAGMLPPVPGLFFSNIFYAYSGDVGPSKEIPGHGNLTVGLDVDVAFYAPSLLWIPDDKFLGGRWGVFGLLPVGVVDTAVDALLTGPGGVPIAGADIEQSRLSIGDPQFGGLIGWNSGHYYYNTGFVVNVPIGDYEPGALDNLAFNHWSVDINGAVTWFDPAIGFELSATAGVTFNDTNSDTDYKTGKELHIEAAALRHASKTFQYGLVGYHYQQISGDSGSGAVLGDFKGRVSALGVHIGGVIPIGKLPLSLAARLYWEFNTKNRLEGNAGFLTLTLPL